jgi:hypothetical protein
MADMVLSRKQFIVLKRLYKPQIENEMADASKVLQYLKREGLCSDILDRVNDFPHVTGKVEITEKGKSAIAEYRRNKLSLLPPWLALLISITSIIISIWSLAAK